MIPDASGTGWWEPARQRALEVLRAEASSYLSVGRTREHPDAALVEEIIRGLPRFSVRRDQIMRPDWLPRRKRRMPRLVKIALYWNGREPFAQDLSAPHCFVRREPCPGCASDSMTYRWHLASSHLERAHLVDHALGGLDAVQNLVPLCHPCHRVMPMFDIGKGDEAVAWVLAGGRLQNYTPENLARLGFAL